MLGVRRKDEEVCVAGSLGFEETPYTATDRLMFEETERKEQMTLKRNAQKEKTANTKTGRNRQRNIW